MRINTHFISMIITFFLLGGNNSAFATSAQTTSTAAGQPWVGTHVALVDGFINELPAIIGLYWADTKTVLTRLDMPYVNYRFASNQSIQDNATALYHTVEHQLKDGHPMILVGHSMGAAESLYMVLTHPELLNDWQITKVVLIQGAIGGSAVVDSIISSWKPCDIIICVTLGAGLNSLKPDVIRPAFRDIYHTFLRSNSITTVGAFDQRKFDDISNRIFYVRSVFHPDRENTFSNGLRLISLFYTTHPSMATSLNDGLVEVNDQQLGIEPFLGIDLGVLTADHMELAISGPFSRSNFRAREEFTEHLVHSIFSNPHTLLGNAEPVRTVWH